MYGSIVAWRTDREGDTITKRVMPAARTGPGDLILVKSPGIGLALARRLLRSKYDHIAVVMGDDETFNIVIPRAVILPLAVVSKPRNAPLVLRPSWDTPEQRERFIAEMR